MSVLSRISTLLKDRRLEGVDPDSTDYLLRHRSILDTRPMMSEVFTEFYRAIHGADEAYFHGADGQRIEVGAGVSFIKNIYPEVVVTDIKPAPHLDKVMDALNLPVPDHSVRSLYGINCFHHFPDIPRFFHEMDRVLHPGGGLVLIEPFYGPFARILYKHLFSSETFDVHQPNWDSMASKMGVMTGANQALSYIVFRRDRQQFAKMFPQFEIVEERPFTNYVRYIFSGGLNFNQLLPNWMIPGLKLLERFLVPFQRLFAVHYMIVIRKKPS